MMSFFSKTGIKHTRLNLQNTEIFVNSYIRRLSIFPRTNPSVNTQEGLQENADYILYGEVGDIFEVNDFIYFNLSLLYRNTIFDNLLPYIKCQIKETPKLYGNVMLGNRNQEIYLKSLN